MELVPRKTIANKRSLASFDSASDMADFAWQYVHNHREKELDAAWKPICSAAQKELPQHFFMREYAWCVYVSGFSAATISKKFSAILQAHRIEKKDGSYIRVCSRNLVPDGDLDHPIMRKVMSVFGNRNKARAIQKMREWLYHDWVMVQEIIKNKDPKEIQQLPFMGPALSCQLARNLGNLDVVKPDVHLNRLAKKYGYKDAQSMCESVAPGSPPALVDLVIWLAAIDHGTS